MKSRIILSGLIPLTGSRRICLGAGAIFIAASTCAHGQGLFWAPPTASGSSATGNWDGSTAAWAPNSDGSGTKVAVTSGTNRGTFSAGGTYTGTSTVTVTGPQAIFQLAFEEGTVTLDGAGTLTLRRDTLAAGEVDVATGLTATINTSVASGANGIIKTGPGTLMLGTGNTSTNSGLVGPISIIDGRLVAGSNDAFQNATNNQLISLGATSGSNSATFSVNRNQDYNSAVIINAGSSGVKRISGGPGLNVTQSPTITGAITLNSNLTLGNGAGGNVGGVNLSGVITGAGTITVDGATAFTDAANPGTLAIIRGASGSSFTGNVVVNQGVLRIGNNGAIGTGTAVVSTASGSALDLNNSGSTASSISIAGLNNGTATGGVVINTASGTSTATLTLAGTGTYSYGGSINDGATSKIALTKTSGGTQTLTGTNTYSGLTTIDTGTLALGASGTINNTSNTTGVALANGGTFDVSAKGGGGYSIRQLTGAGTVNGVLTVSTRLAIGASPGTVTFNNNLTLGGTSVSDFEFTNTAFGAGTYDLAQAQVSGTQNVAFGGTLNLLFSGGTYQENTPIKIFNFDTYSGNFSTVTVSGLTGFQSATFNPAAGTVTVVPEPGSALLGGLGLMALLRRRRSA